MRWPETHREDARTLLASNAEARELLAEARELDAFLVEPAPTPSVRPQAVSEVMERVAAMQESARETVARKAANAEGAPHPAVGIVRRAVREMLSLMFRPSLVFSAALIAGVIGNVVETLLVPHASMSAWLALSSAPFIY